MIRVIYAPVQDIDLENVQGFDSNAFTMKLFDDNDDLIYFHVVFTGETPGRRGGGGKRYSFAEIVGKDKPEEVIMWKEMDEESESKQAHIYTTSS